MRRSRNLAWPATPETLVGGAVSSVITTRVRPSDVVVRDERFSVVPTEVFVASFDRRRKRVQRRSPLFESRIRGTPSRGKRSRGTDTLGRRGRLRRKNPQASSSDFVLDDSSVVRAPAADVDTDADAEDGDCDDAVGVPVDRVSIDSANASANSASTSGSSPSSEKESGASPSRRLTMASRRRRNRSAESRCAAARRTDSRFRCEPIRSRS